MFYFVCKQMLKKFQKNANIISREIAGEMLLVPISGRLADIRRLFALNRTARHIWERLDGHADHDELVQSIQAQFNVSAETAAADVDAFLALLAEHGLIEPVEPPRDGPGSGTAVRGPAKTPER